MRISDWSSDVCSSDLDAYARWPLSLDLSQYLPILLFLGIAVLVSGVFVGLPVLVATLTGAQNPYPDKLTEYECGFPAFEVARRQFDVRFYLVSLLFIIFDLDAAFLFSWAVRSDERRGVNEWVSTCSSRGEQ